MSRRGACSPASTTASRLVDRVPGVREGPEFQRAVIKVKELRDAAKTAKAADKK